MKSKQILEFRIIEEIKDSKKHAMAMGPFGSNITIDNFVEKGIPVIRGKNLKNNHFSEEDFVFLTEEKADQLIASNAYPEDIIFTHRGTLGQVVIIPKNSKFKRYVISQSQMKLSCDKSKINPMFVYYYFCSPQGQQEIFSYTNTTGVPSISSPLSSLKIMQIPYPKLDEQIRISQILENLDDKIKNLQEQNKVLENIAQTIFKSWFVDFDGIAEFEDSELGKIPKGWSIKKLADVCITQYGYTESANHENVGPKFLRITDMNKKEWIDWEKVPYCTITKDNFEKYSLKQGDIVVSRMADTGKVGIIEEKIDAVFASYLVRLKIQSIEQSYFFFYFLRSTKYQEYAKGVSGSGTVQKNMNAKMITDINILIPTDKNLKLFFDLVYPIRTKIINNIHKINQLSKIKDTLLPKLMSGQIRIPMEVRK